MSTSMNQTIYSNFSKQLLVQWQTILLSVVTFAVIGFFVSTMLTPRYESSAQLLVVQKYGGEKIDAFSAARGAEYLSNILVRVVGTNAFMEESMTTSKIVDDLPKGDPEKRLKAWDKKVTATKVNNAGILEIIVNDASRKEANDLVWTMANAFVTNGGKYHGGGDNVEIRLIDGPVTMTRPTLPNIPLNTVFASLVGVIAGVGIVYLQSIRRSKQVSRSFAQSPNNETFSAQQQYE